MINYWVIFSHLTANTVLKDEKHSVLYLTTKYPNIDVLVKVMCSITNSAKVCECIDFKDLMLILIIFLLIILKFCKKHKQFIIDANDSFIPCLQQVEFCHLTDVHNLMEILWKCGTKENPYKLIIIDSLAALFAPLIGDSHNDGN